MILIADNMVLHQNLIGPDNAEGSVCHLLYLECENPKQVLCRGALREVKKYHIKIYSGSTEKS